MPNISIADAGVAALLGYAVVFVGLGLLMAVIVLLGKAMGMGVKAKASAPAVVEVKPAAAEAPPAPAVPAAPPAPGSAGEVKLFDVPDREAAMLMAIVADAMGKPLNELRFKSMKEVK